MEEEQSASRQRRGKSVPGSFEFRNVSLTVLWARMALTATQLARLTGLSRRQIEWWRARGYLPLSPAAPDRFNGDAITLALLMRQAVEAGIPPARAHQLAARHLAERLAAGLAEAAAGNADIAANTGQLVHLQQRLLATHNTIGLVLDVIAPLLRRVEQQSGEDSPPRGSDSSSD